MSGCAPVAVGVATSLLRFVDTGAGLQTNEVDLLRLGRHWVPYDGTVA